MRYPTARKAVSSKTVWVEEKDRATSEDKKENCLLCDQNLWRLECAAKDELIGQKGSYFYFCCQNCGFVVLHPKPSQEDFNSLYPEDSYPPFLTTQKRRLFSNFVISCVSLKRSHRVFQYQQRGRLLDIGCASGYFLEEMVRRGGWDCVGIEPSPQTAKETASRLGISVIPNSIEEAVLEENSLDVVSAWDVLEHVRDPRIALKKIYRWLKENGLFIASMPNIDSLEYRLFRRFWFNLDPPRHFWHFTTRTIQQLLEDEGFHVARIETSFWSSCEAFLKSWRYLVRRWTGLQGNLFFFNISGIPLLVAFFPILYLSHVFKKGSILFVWARKKAV